MSPLLTAAAKLAETEVRRILRRVTAPANKKEAKMTMKPLGRMLAKIMHSAPLAVAEQLIRQVGGGKRGAVQCTAVGKGAQGAVVGGETRWNGSSASLFVRCAPYTSQGRALRRLAGGLHCRA